MTYLINIKEINIELDSEELNQAQQIFVSYFSDLYRDIPREILGIGDIPGYLNDIFNRNKIALKELTLRGFLAYIDGEPVGFSTCGLLEDSTTLLIRTMPIYLLNKNRGIQVEIKKKFLSYMHQQFPTSLRTIMMVRKANKVQSSLCLQAGFKKNNSLFNESEYLKTKYDINWYEPYLLVNGSCLINPS